MPVGASTQLTSSPACLPSVQIGLRFRPQDAKPTSSRTTCTFNGVAMTAAPLVLSGTAHEPRLTFDVPTGTLFFRCGWKAK